MKIEEFISNFGIVRTITEDEAIWFLAKDIALALGYKNERDAIRKHTFESDRKALNYVGCRDLRQSNICSLWEGNDRKALNYKACRDSRQAKILSLWDGKDF